VPAITFLGQSTSWRVAYLTVAVVFALTLAAIALVVPHQSGDATATMRRELSALRRGQVWVVLGCGALGFGGLFAVYTFIAPVATEVTGLPASSVPLVLVVLGIGMTIGNAAGGRGSDHHVVGTVFVCFAVFAIALAGFALTASTPVGLFVFAFLVGGAAFALGPAIQSWVIDVSGDSQTMAAALNHSALNLGNSLGAWLGGVTIAAGLGYLSPAWVGLALCVPGVILAVVGAVLSRRARRLEVAGQV
jgi:DHA1 family inner membrane transport protein